jgi:hopene-associated glycosyltransferase HpnB
VVAAVAAVGLGAASLCAWLAIGLRPSRFWDLRPVAEEQPAPPAPDAWPPVCVLVPAHDEALELPRTLPSVLGQDYPGGWRVVVVDDRSGDGTGEVARGLATERVTVVDGAALPPGWAGKVWALEQGSACAGGAPYLFLTDADIWHAPGTLRRLVAQSEAGGLALNSRMARLRNRSAAERLLVPPFVWFFNLLYPMRLVNAGRRPAAAGGCVLLRASALHAAGGFGAIRGAVIDDVSLARAVHGAGGRVRLAVSAGDTRSLRVYGSLGPLWRMVSRSAFDELGHSWLRLAGVVAGLTLLFAVPPALVVVGAGGLGLDARVRTTIGALGAAGWLGQSLLFLRCVRFFGQPAAWALSLPLAGLLYAAMTVDSAVRFSARRQRWR